MTADMMYGDEKVCGVITSGGTERYFVKLVTFFSILMACKTYRDRSKVANPEMYLFFG
jgi:hypothetical protein